MSATIQHVVVLLFVVFDKWASLDNEDTPLLRKSFVKTPNTIIRVDEPMSQPVL